MGRPRFAGHTRWDDHQSIPDETEVDIDLLPWSDDTGYLQRRRDAELEHARRQLRRIDQVLVAGGDLPPSDASHLARLSREHALWTRLAAELEQLQPEQHWTSGDGDRRLF